MASWILQEIVQTNKNDQVMTRMTTLYWRQHWHIMPLENGACYWRRRLIWEASDLKCMIWEGVWLDRVFYWSGCLIGVGTLVVEATLYWAFSYHNWYTHACWHTQLHSSETMFGRDNNFTIEVPNGMTGFKKTMIIQNRLYLERVKKVIMHCLNANVQSYILLTDQAN